MSKRHIQSTHTTPNRQSEAASITGRKLTRMICVGALAASLPAIFGAAAGCSSAVEDHETGTTATVKQDLYYLSGGVWSTQAIPVCFTSVSGGENDVKRFVEESYSRMVGIFFSGWGNCSRDAAGNVNAKGIRISWAAGRAGTASPLGRHNDGTTDITLDPGRDLQYPAVHEFGHALGFAHEQNRPNAPMCHACLSPNREACVSNAACASGHCVAGHCTPCADEMEDCDPVYNVCHQGGDGDQRPTVYDPYSNMNYCSVDRAGTPRNQTGLSPFDVVGARIAYGHSPERIGLRLSGPSRATGIALCLGVVGVDSSTADAVGARVEAYPCLPSPGDHKWDEVWTFRPTSDGWSRVVNNMTGLCLGVQGINSFGAGAGVEVYPCDPVSGDSKTDEEWKLVDQEGWRLMNRANQQLYLGASELRSGALLTMESTGLRLAEYVTPVTDPNFTPPDVTVPTSPVIKLRNKLSGYCLGVPGVDDPNVAGGTLVEVYDCEASGTDAKQDEEWIIMPTSNDYFRLVNAASVKRGSNGLCLGVVGPNDGSDGARVEVYSCPPVSGDALTDEEWKWSGDKLVNRINESLCLGVVGVDNHGLGAGVEIYPCQATDADAKNDERWQPY